MRKLLLLTLLSASSCFAEPQDIQAKSWLVADEHGMVSIGKNLTEQRSIASITKLMTVMVVIDGGQSLAEKLGKYTREQLIKLALIKSDNQASDLLCNNMPGGRSACVHNMNQKAKQLGMLNTKFVEPTGLSPMNISTAVDLVKLVQQASVYPQIVDASNTASTKITNTIIQNTNQLVKSIPLLVSKTGTTNAAGRCLVMMDTNHRIYVLLGMDAGRRLLESKEIVKL